MDPTYNYQYLGNVPPEMTGVVTALFGGMLLFFLILLIAVYVVMAISLMKIANRTNTENAWFAWIPILNLILMLQIAQRPL